jgi:hypothetical protein
MLIDSDHFSSLNVIYFAVMFYIPHSITNFICPGLLSLRIRLHNTDTLGLSSGIKRESHERTDGRTNERTNEMSPLYHRARGTEC